MGARIGIPPFFKEIPEITPQLVFINMNPSFPQTCNWKHIDRSCLCVDEG